MKKIMIITSVFLSSLMYAQNNEDSNIKEQNSTKVRVYTPTSSINYESYKWAVKTDLFSFLGGEFPLILEYKISEKVSVEGSVGVTYGIYKKSFDIGGFFSSDDDANDVFKTEGAFGSAFRAGIKYYPSLDYEPIEGWAFGVQLFRKTNRLNYIENSNFTAQELNDKQKERTRIGAMLTISKQLFRDSNISFEYFLGIGIENKKESFLKDNSSFPDRKFIEKSTDKTGLSFNLGLRVGFGK